MWARLVGQAYVDDYMSPRVLLKSLHDVCSSMQVQTTGKVLQCVKPVSALALVFHIGKREKRDRN